MRRGARVLLAACATCALVACGLPVERGVQVPQAGSAGGPVAGADQAGTTVYLPPGPREGAPPVGVVAGFLDAQASAEDDHAIARQFLAAEFQQTWDDEAQVKVYDPLQPKFEVIGDVNGDVVQVRMRAPVTATIAADGSLDPTAGQLDEIYSLRKNASGNWVLTGVPDGLRLRPEIVDRSYTSQLIYYLATETGPDGHLVPDPALLLLDQEPAESLVRRLVAGPSASLAGAVDTAVPEEAEVVAVTTDGTGLVTVDLGPALAQAEPLQLERLSAQLVWTLRGAGTAFSQLRLLSAGQPVEVPGVAGDVQERTAWAGYDPDGLDEQVTTYYLADRRLHTLESERPVAALADVAVDRAAVSPRTDQLAVLTEVGDGRWELRTGPASGPVGAEPLYTGGGLRSPSWGSGRRGLWLLQTGPEPQVLLVDGAGEARPVPMVEPPPGSITALRVSRDGARIALIAGEDDASRRVYVAPLLQDGGLRIGRPREVGFGVTDVSDIAWESPTSIVALGKFRNLERLPLSLTIDGSGDVDLVPLPGLEQVAPESLAWAPDRPLVVAATRDGQSVLLGSTAGVFAEVVEPGYAPFYPG